MVIVERKSRRIAIAKEAFNINKRWLLYKGNQGELPLLKKHLTLTRDGYCRKEIKENCHC